jgi:hypothetical protein
MAELSVLPGKNTRTGMNDPAGTTLWYSWYSVEETNGPLAGYKKKERRKQHRSPGQRFDVRAQSAGGISAADYFSGNFTGSSLRIRAGAFSPVRREAPC